LAAPSNIIQVVSYLEEIHTAQWIENTAYILVATKDDRIRVWSTQRMQPIIEFTFRDLTACTAILTFQYLNDFRSTGIQILASRSNSTVASVSFYLDGSKWIFLEQNEFTLGNLSQIHLLVVEYGVLFAADWNGRMMVVDLKRQIQRLLPIGQPSPVTSICIDGALVHGTYNGSLCYWNK
jgi:WD40 repeat protein